MKLAKVAILYFAQYVQTNYIDGTAFASLWSGSLVDVVNYINQIGSYVVNVGTTTISRVKHGLGTAWQGIKAGAEYIANAVLTPILQSFQYLLIKLIETILIITTKLTSITYSTITNGFNIVNGGNSVSFEVKISNHFSIELVINGITIVDIATPYLAPITNFETLTVDENEIQSTALDIGLLIDGITIFNYFIAFAPSTNENVLRKIAIESFVPIMFLELSTYLYYFDNVGQDSAKYFAKTMVANHAIIAKVNSLGGLLAKDQKIVIGILSLLTTIQGSDYSGLINYYYNPISRPIVGALGIYVVGIVARFLSGDLTAAAAAKNIATLTTDYLVMHLLMLIIFGLLD